MAAAVRPPAAARAALLAVTVLLSAGCTTPAERGPPVASPPAASAPNQPELARLETEFRARDRELGDLLAEAPPPECSRISPLQDHLVRLNTDICALSSSRDSGRYRPGVPCQYAMARLRHLGEQAQKLGCQRRERSDWGRSAAPLELHDSIQTQRP